MIGLGVGIDYALFLVTRHRQQLMDGVDPVHAAGRAVATSGRAVLVSGCTVIVALAGLYVSRIQFIGRLGAAAAVTVVTAVIGALVLVPALLGLIGRRIDKFSVRKPIAEREQGEADRSRARPLAPLRAARAAPALVVPRRWSDRPRRPGDPAVLHPARAHRRRRRPDELYRPPRLRPDRDRLRPRRQRRRSPSPSTRARYPQSDRSALAGKLQSSLTERPRHGQRQPAATRRRRRHPRLHGHPDDLAAGPCDQRPVQQPEEQRPAVRRVRNGSQGVRHRHDRRADRLRRTHLQPAATHHRGRRRARAS